MNSLVSELFDIANRVYENRTSKFSGIALLLYSKIEELPVVPLRRESVLDHPIKSKNEIIAYLSNISNFDSDLHDGFHLISNDLYLTNICNYFSPPIIPDISPPLSYGGRFRAGLYGSYIPSMIACAVASNNYRPTIFVKGKIYYPE